MPVLQDFPTENTKIFMKKLVYTYINTNVHYVHRLKDLNLLRN